MQGAAVPVHEATVSSDLRRLLAECGWRRSGPGTEKRTLSPSVPREPPAAPSARPQPPAIPWCDVALRRDGLRPLRLKGLLVHRTEVRAGDGSACLSLYATPDGGAVAQLSYEPPGSLPVRSVFRVAAIDGPEDLSRFIGTIGPEHCLAVNPGGLDDSTRAECERLRLPRILPGLARPDAQSHHSREGKPT